MSPALVQVKKYCEDVNRRLEDGELIPTSNDGVETVSYIVATSKDVTDLIIHENSRSFAGQSRDASELLELIELQIFMTLIVGKMLGFGYGQKHVLSRAGAYSNYLI